MPTSIKQLAQRELSWKLKVVTGAQGTLYPREFHLSHDVQLQLMLIHRQLEFVEKLLRKQLKELK